MNLLTEIAQNSLRKAYNLYSSLSIVCALKTKKVEILDGINIENSYFGLTMCAQRVAVFKDVSEGHIDIEEIAIVSSTRKHIYPCGACRQVLFEINSKMKTYLRDGNVLSLLDLLPFAFSKDYLN
jgi:cytidine deaminase